MSSNVQDAHVQPVPVNDRANEVRTERVGVDVPVAKREGHVNSSIDGGAHQVIHGIIPTVLTPFDESEQVDDVALRAQVEYLLNSAVHGLVLLGSLGECPYLNDDDREIVVRTCVDTASSAGRTVPIIVGIAAPSTYVAAEQIRQAHHLGAQAVMVCLPQYFKLTLDDVKRHYTRLGELSLLPILYYHFPAVTGLDFKPSQIAEILALPNVVGIKETTLDMLSVQRHIAATRGLDRVYLSGSELVFGQFMDIGGHGVVGASSLVMPRTAVAMYEAYKSGDKSKARELQSLLFETMPLARDVRAPIALVRTAFLLAQRQGVEVPIDTVPMQARLKAALAGLGLPIRPFARSPLPPLTPHDEQAVRQALECIARIERRPGLKSS
jgi:4-hydroxy-tetrahydrodipicolinate synthase/2-dehydro-3-deoxy-phosphogluconate/2-dehydro-3-deoxy-6-phosphogalactonate aldolase